MNNINKIFSVMFKRCGGALGLVMLAAAMISAPAHAASRNGCEDFDTNDRINPVIALCSVHAYNVGATENPETPDVRQTMNEVVALKSTIIAQQMKKQYDYLEVTIKRFKTQLEKAILTAKMEAAGATPESGGASGSGGTGGSSDRNVILSGAENCRLKTSSSTAYECLQNNLRIVRNAVAANNLSQAKRQLDLDLQVAALYEIGTKENSGYVISGCKSLQTNRNSINGCLDNFNVMIIRKIEDNNKKQSANPFAAFTS